MPKVIWRKLIKKISIIVVRGILIGSGIVTILSWFGVKPPEKPTSLFGEIFKILFFQIPLIWAIFISGIIIFIVFRFGRQNKQKIDKEIKKDIKLTKEHNCILLYLLEKKDCKCLEHELESIYIEEMQKCTSDFNILKQELLEANLVYEIHSHYGSVWKLTGKGLKIAGEMYKFFSEKH